MSVTITSVTLIGGNPPTQVRIQGAYTDCEKVDVWISCVQGQIGAYHPSLSAADPSNFIFDINLPSTCQCEDTIYVTMDCHQGLGRPSSAAGTTKLTFDCDCCPKVTLQQPITPSYTGGIPVVSFQLVTPGTWIPSGCTPPVQITGYKWTVKNGSIQYVLITSPTITSASTDTGNWTDASGAAVTVPLSLLAGAWTVNVKPTFSSGSLSSNCEIEDDGPFSVSPSVSIPKCCPYDHSAPNGVKVTIVFSGAIPSATATFTATIFWPKRCKVVTPSNYSWEVTDPAGNTFVRDTTTNITYSNNSGADWVLNHAQIGPLPLDVGGQYVVGCTVDFPPNTSASSCRTWGTGSSQLTGPPPIVTADCCPSVGVGVSFSAATASSGPTASFSTTTTWPSGCQNIVPTSFAWIVTDETTNTTFSKTTTTPTTDQTAFSPPLTLTPAHSYAVQVTPSYPGLTLPAGCNPVGKSPSATVTGGTTPSSGSGSTTPSSGLSGCAILLIISIVLLLIGGIVVAIGICINVVWVWIFGAAIGVVGAILFGFWVWLCASTTPCSLMRTMECILNWIVKVGVIIAIITAIIGYFGGGLPCSIGIIAVWSGWAFLDNILQTVMFKVKCPPIDCTQP